MFANDCTERENAMADSLASSLSVGWIGTGRMGTPLVSRLADAGLDVAAWNRTRSKAEPLAAHGVTVVDTLGDLAERDVVFTMVSADDDLEEVVRRPAARAGRAPGAGRLLDGLGDRLGARARDRRGRGRSRSWRPRSAVTARSSPWGSSAWSAPGRRMPSTACARCWNCSAGTSPTSARASCPGW
jgi:hypothetical protein